MEKAILFINFYQDLKFPTLAFFEITLMRLKITAMIRTNRLN